MAYARSLIAALAVCPAACAVLWAGAPAAAQTPATPGIFIAVEGQRVFGDSDFAVGFVPPNAFDIGPEKILNEGQGWGGALTLGYRWDNGWSGAVRFRRLRTDNAGGPVEPGIIAFDPQFPFVPGGFLVDVFGAQTRVESEASLFDLEIGKEIQVAGARLEFFGGLTHAAIKRDAVLIGEGCGCVPLAFAMAHDFRGVGPKIGLRGDVPLFGGVSLVGAGSVAALIGTSTFKSRLDDPLTPPSPQFKAEDDRTVVALEGEAGLAFAIGPGNLTVGYRANAIYGALDTDQRVSPLMMSLGFPQIGDSHADFIQHGPFARFTLPLSGVMETASRN